MAYSDEKALKGHIASKKYNNIYVIFGDEKYLVKHYSNLLIKKKALQLSQLQRHRSKPKPVKMQ